MHKIRFSLANVLTVIESTFIRTKILQQLQKCAYLCYIIVQSQVIAIFSSIFGGQLVAISELQQHRAQSIVGWVTVWTRDQKVDFN